MVGTLTIQLNKKIITIFLVFLFCFMFLTQAFSKKAKIDVVVVNNHFLFSSDAESTRAKFTQWHFQNVLEKKARFKSCDPRFFPAPYPFPPSSQKNPKKYRKLVRKCVVENNYPAPTNTQFKTKWDQKAHSFKKGYLIGEGSKKRKIKLKLKNVKNPRLKKCDWSIGNRTEKNQSCVNFVTILSLGQHSIGVKSFYKNKRNRAIVDQALRQYRLRDFLMVAMGDSMASGEGNPHLYYPKRTEKNNSKYNRNPPQWLDSRCHRSIYSASGQTATLLSNVYEEISFSYVNLACSGATSGPGILEKYHGRSTANQLMSSWTHNFNRFKSYQYPRDNEIFKGYKSGNGGTKPKSTRDIPAPFDIDSQLNQLRKSLCDGNDCRKPDMIIINVGVNDIQFSKQFLSLAKGCNGTGPCANLGVERVKKGLEHLEKNMGALNDRLKDNRFDIFPSSPKDIYLVKYTNPLRGKKGRAREFCSNEIIGSRVGANVLQGIVSIAGFGIKQEGTKWAENALLGRLNATIDEIVAKLGWSTIGSPGDLLSHGYCNKKKRHFNNFIDATNKQGPMQDDFKVSVMDCELENKCHGEGGDTIPAGILHPNFFGHRNLAQKYFTEIEKKYRLR